MRFTELFHFVSLVTLSSYSCLFALCSFGMESPASFAEVARSVVGLTAAVQKLQVEVESIKTHLANPPVSVVAHANSTIEPRPAPIPPFHGDPRLGRGFLAQCEITFRLQSSRFQSDESRIGFVAGAFTSQALTWYTAIADKTPSLLHDYEQFRVAFLRIFSSPSEIEDAAVRIHKIKQGNRSVSEYAVEFRVIAAQCDITDDSMRGAFYAGLNDSIKQGLINQYPTSFDELVNLSLRVDARHRQLKGSSSDTQGKTLEVSNGEESMELGRAERVSLRRRGGQRRGWCNFCGQTGHFAARCPERLNSQAH